MVKKQSTLHIGIKSWAKGTKKVIANHWAMGSQIVIGPVIEWKPFNGLALQTGLLHSYNCFFTISASVDSKKLLDKSFFLLDVALSIKLTLYLLKMKAI